MTVWAMPFGLKSPIASTRLLLDWASRISTNRFRIGPERSLRERDYVLPGTNLDYVVDRFIVLTLNSEVHTSALMTKR